MKTKFLAPVILLFSVFIYSCEMDESTSTPEFSQELSKRHKLLSEWEPMDPCDATFISICYEGCDSDPVNRDIFNDAIDELNSVPNTSLFFGRVQDCKRATVTYECVDDCGFSYEDAHHINGLALKNDDGTFTVKVLSRKCREHFDIEECNGILSPEEVICHTLRTSIHELMHVIGFAHFHDTAASQLEGTPEQDLHSIMTPGGCNELRPADHPINLGYKDESCELSDGDILAIQTLYPVIDDCIDCPHKVQPCDCPDQYGDQLDRTCYCVCEYFDTFKDEWIEYSRYEISCQEAECSGAFESNTARCFVEEDCKFIGDIDPPPPPPSDDNGCSYCPCTTDADCPQGFTCQSPGTGAFMICLP